MTNDKEKKPHFLNLLIFKCRECGWIGKESEMTYADNGWDYSEYCPICGDCMISNANYHCDEVKHES